MGNLVSLCKWGGGGLVSCTSRLWCLASALSVATPDHSEVGIFQLVSLHMFCVYIIHIKLLNIMCKYHCNPKGDTAD